MVNSLLTVLYYKMKNIILSIILIFLTITAITKGQSPIPDNIDDLFFELREAILQLEASLLTTPFTQPPAPTKCWRDVVTLNNLIRIVGSTKLQEDLIKLKESVSQSRTEQESKANTYSLHAYLNFEKSGPIYEKLAYAQKRRMAEDVAKFYTELEKIRCACKTSPNQKKCIQDYLNFPLIHTTPEVACKTCIDGMNWVAMFLDKIGDCEKVMDIVCTFSCNLTIRFVELQKLERIQLELHAEIQSKDYVKIVQNYKHL